MANSGLTDREHQLLVDLAKSQLALISEAQSRLKADILRGPRNQIEMAKEVRSLAHAEANLEYDLKMMGKL